MRGGMMGDILLRGKLYFVINIDEGGRRGDVLKS